MLDSELSEKNMVSCVYVSVCGALPSYILSETDDCSYDHTSEHFISTPGLCLC